MKTKGQLFTGDATLAIAVALILLSTYIINYWDIHQDTQNKAQRTGRETTAYLTAEILASTPGKPANWTADTIQAIGLLTPNQQQISLEKLQELTAIDYETLRYLTGAGNHEIQITIKDQNQDTIMQAGNPPGKTSAATTETRTVKHQDETYSIQTIIHTPQHMKTR